MMTLKQVISGLDAIPVKTSWYLEVRSFGNRPRGEMEETR